jgi:UDP-N-acetyl-D-galactosamine dehydrogenase
LVKELQAWGCKVVVTDPWANAEEVQHEYGITLGSITPNQPVDSLVVAVGHHEFRDMTPSDLRQLCRNGHQPVLGDIKSLYNRQALADVGFTVFRF